VYSDFEVLEDHRCLVSNWIGLWDFSIGIKVISRFAEPNRAVFLGISV